MCNVLSTTHCTAKAFHTWRLLHYLSSVGTHWQQQTEAPHSYLGFPLSSCSCPSDLEICRPSSWATLPRRRRRRQPGRSRKWGKICRFSLKGHETEMINVTKMCEFSLVQYKCASSVLGFSWQETMLATTKQNRVAFQNCRGLNTSHTVGSATVLSSFSCDNV